MSKKQFKRSKNKAGKAKTNQPKRPTKGKGAGKTAFYLALFVGLLGFLLYANTLSHDYAYDDFGVVKSNFIVKKGLAGIPEILTTDYRFGFWNAPGELYRPLSLVLFAIQWEIAPDSPALAHWTNVLLYAATGFFLFMVMRRLMKGYHILLPFLTSVLFIAHPIHTEVVANIKSADEILAFLFSLWSILYLWKFLESERKSQLGLSLLMYTLALFSKESTLSYIAIFPLLIYFFGRPAWLSRIKTAAWYLAPVVLYWIARSIVLGGVEARTVDTSTLDNLLVAAPNFLAEKATAFLMMGIYIWKLILPNPLVSDMGYNQVPITTFADWRVLLSLATYAGAFGYAIYRFKEKHVTSFAILFYLLTFFLFSNLLVVIGSSYGERFIYISSLGFAIGLSWLILHFTGVPLRSEEKFDLSGFFQKYTVGMGIGLVLLLAYASLTIQRNPDWYSSYTLYAADAPKSPNSAKLRYHHGLEVMKEGLKKPAAEKAEWFKRSIVEMDAAIQIYPQYHDAYGEKGLAYYRLNQPDEALKNYELSLKYKPQNATVYSNMGIIYMAKNNLPKAQEVYEKAIKIDPRFVDGRRNLGSVYARQRQFAKAIEQFKAGLTIEPQNATLLFYLGSAYRDSGDPATAEQYLNRAYQLEPSLRR